MMQSKKSSFIESSSNAIFSFMFNYAASLFIYPLLDIKVTGVENIEIAVLFAIISVIRGYLVRRWFNSHPS